MVADEVLGVVRGVIGQGSRKLHQPRTVSRIEVELGEAPLWAFEAELKRITGAEFVEPVSSGTAALQLTLMAAGVRADHEVLCPSLTFAASANAIVHAGAVPHFIDINVQTLGVHPFKLRQYLGLKGFERTEHGCINTATGRKVSAIMPVHLLGNPCSIYEIARIADAYGIAVIEDAAEALGSTTPDGRACGTIGLAGTLSFNLNKIVTTGGGGAVLTNNSQIARRVSHLAAQAKVEHRFLWRHDEVGWNYRLSPLCATLGVEQLGRLEQTLEAKDQLWARYAVGFENSTICELMHVAGSNNWLNMILLDSRVMHERDAAITALLDDGFEARAIFSPLHTLPHFKHCPRQDSLAGAEDIWRRAICLPSTP